MNQHELIEFFGVLPEINEEDCYEFYRVSKNDIKLDVTFFYPHDIYISLFQLEIEKPIFSTTLKGNIELERLRYKNNYDCLELKIPYLKAYDEEDWNYPFWLRIFIDPTISIEVIR
jgi:hypothetical protein